MRRISFIVISFIFVCFLIPVLFTTKGKTENNSVAIAENKLEEKYDYEQYNTIKLLHTDTNKVEEINLDEYLYGVVSAEMPVSFEEEALKAQAIVARTYTIYKIVKGSKHENADICDNSTCCQAWITKENRMARWDETEAEANWRKIVNAVESTKGKIITYDGSPINAFFHSNSGGKTEVVSNVWGGTDLPYLQTVETARRRCIFTI